MPMDPADALQASCHFCAIILNILGEWQKPETRVNKRITLIKDFRHNAPRLAIAWTEVPIFDADSTAEETFLRFLKLHATSDPEPLRRIPHLPQSIGNT